MLKSDVKGLLNDIKAGDEEELNDSKSMLTGDAVVLKGDG